ncbi:MAG: hypothetical protein PHQ23_13085 [Candidatus Wallbacteria bacterium]|nr:hypothetical protein [Candidatus Wallbacteria bacterium]
MWRLDSQYRPLLFMLIFHFLVQSAMLFLPEKLIEPDDEIYKLSMEMFSQGRFSIPKVELRNYPINIHLMMTKSVDGRSVSKKPPGYGIWLAGLHLSGMERLSSLILGSFFITGLFFLLKESSDHHRLGREFSVACFLLITCPTFMVLSYMTYMSDLGSAVFISLGIILYYLARSRGLKTATLISGVLAGISVSFRYTNVFALPVIILWEAWMFFRERKSSLPGLFLFVVGFGLAVAPLMVYHQHFFGSFFATGYKLTQIIGVQQGVFSVDKILDNFWKVLPQILKGYPFLLLAPLGLFMSRKRDFLQSLLVIWTAVFLSSYLFFAGSLPQSFVFTGRKFFPFVLPLCVLAALGLQIFSWKQILSSMTVLLIINLSVVTEFAQTAIFANVWDFGTLSRNRTLYSKEKTRIFAENLEIIRKLEQGIQDLDGNGTIDNVEKKLIGIYMSAEMKRLRDL